MQFAQTIFLWALAGLSVPIAIHLLSKKEGKVIRLGSLRHVRETSTQQFKSIRLNEWLLLALRCLILVLWVLLLSGLQFDQTKHQQWLVVDQSVKNHPMAKKWMDSLQVQGFELHWLADGFPKEEPSVTSKNYWESIASLRQRELQRVIVLSSSGVEQFVGMRESLPASIQWITLPAIEQRFVAEALQKSNNDYLIRLGTSSSDATEFETIRTSSKIDSVETKSMLQQKVLIVADEAFEKDARMLKASLQAIQEKLAIQLRIQQLNSGNHKSTSSDWLFWLSNKKVPSSDSVSVVFYNPESGSAILKSVGLKQWTMTKRLSISIMEETNFTLQLASILIPEKEKWKNIRHYDRRALPDSFLHSTTSSGVVSDAFIENHFNYYLFVLLLLVFMIERWVAYRKNQ
ncbi:MAG: BatA domain-containing protein [Bacteroidetes bacterium]|nr:BatA domain-containing protein [Bacteroidota bacterium]